jgi:two-component system CheB/CheR fusion protein
MTGISSSDNTFLTGEAGEERVDEFLIVGMGASAGGIQAFKQFFERVPADSGMAYVVILHLSPDHDSKLAEVLQSSAAIPVAQVSESIRIEPNHVYVIPPNKSLSMDDGVLALSEIKGYEERRAPVDIFFRTLATEHTTRAVSVILSGTGANGSMGVKRVKEMGGIILVQDPREAEYSDMPRNSIATGLVDYVLPVAEIPAKIIAYKENLKEVSIPIEEPERPETDEQALRDVFTQLRMRTRHDFSNYKRATVLRRIERRINVHELASLPEYARFVREHKEEARALLKDLLISVTNFFRDSAAFGSVEQRIIPQLFEGKGADDYLRVWVAGCATGEEAYSLSMMLLDYAAKVTGAPSVQVFATDIDEQAISRARNGFYTNSDVADVPPERLRRYFTKEADGYHVRRELRETVLFAHHNLIKDPPFSHLDMISCRNLLIYLNRTAQERVMQVMHFALNPGGFLFLGTSESVDGAGDLFVTVDNEAHVYQGRVVTPRVVIPLPDVSPRLVADPRPQTERTREPRAREDRVTYSDLHHRLIEQYGPPSVVVNEEYSIVHLSERAGRYLQFTGGEASLNLLKVIRPELRLELRTALYQAAQNRTNVEARRIAARLDDGAQMVNLMVRPVLRADDTARGFFLVLFEETPAGANPEGDTAAAETIITAEPAMLQLEDELTRVKAQLRANIEQYETQAEEMKASNEELQAMNEELRSSAEELETSKEELQSLNEELHTVNQELKIKIEELSHANNDFRNLMFSTDIGTIFLDRSLHIKLFTPRARDIFKLIPADVGRPLSDISSNLPHDGLLAEVETVLDRLQTVEREVGTRDGRFYLMRIVPYRTTEDRIEGVVLNFVDITERRRAEEARFLLASIVESSQDSVITVNFDRKITSWNRAAEVLYGYAAAEAIGKPLTMLTLPEDLREVLANIDKVKHSETVEIFDTVRMNRDGREMNLEVLLSPVRDAAGRVIGVSTIARDVTERRRAEEALRESQDQLRLALEASEMGTFLWYPQEDRSELDARMLTLLGLRESETMTLATALATAIHPDDREFYRASVAAAIDPNGNAKLDIDYRVVHPNGSIRWLHIYGNTSFTSENPPRAALMYGMALDITERKRAEANLAFLAEVSDHLVRLTNIDETMSSLCEKIGEHFNATRVVFAEIGEDETTSVIRHEWRQAHLPTLKEAAALKDFLVSKLAAAQRDGDISYIRDVTAELRDAALTLTALGIASLLGAPLVRDEKLHLYLGILDSQPREWRTDEIELMRESTNRIRVRLERARAEEDLRESESRLRALVENLPGGAVFIVNQDMRYAVAQGEALATAGFKSEDLIGRTIAEAMPPELAASYESMYRKALAGETFEHEHEAHGRSYISRGVPLAGAAGDVYAVLAISYDITERRRAEEALRESEERLRLLVESVTDYAIFTLDNERRVRSWNPGAELIFGFTESEIVGQSVDLLFTPEDREQGIPEQEITQARAVGRAADERWHIRKDGTRFYASGVLAALSGGRQGFAKIARDLTRQKRAGEELQRAHDELEGRVRERTFELLDLNETLLAEVKERTAAEAHARQLMRQIVTAQEDERRSVARDLHDHLGQQLTGLRIKLENHKQSCGGGDPSHRAEVEQIQAIAERLDADVDFLAWELRPASLDELGLPAALANFVREWSEHFDIPAEFHTTGLDRQRLPPEVEINLYRIAQEALNNISKHSEATGVDVLLERRDQHVALIVEDDGKGFEPDGGAKPDGKRIGLLNMRERAAYVGARLEIESAPGEGTTVFARVPIRAEDAPRESGNGDGAGGSA